MNPKWMRVPISHVYLGLFDGPHATPKPSKAGGVFLGIKNITDDGHLDYSDIRHIAEDDMPRWTRRVTPQRDDIVFTYEATLNRYALIPAEFYGCLGRRLALIRPNTKVVDPRFLFYYFFSSDWRATIASKMITGSTVDRIPLIDFPNFPISIPDVQTQKKIVASISAYDDLIANNNRRIAVLEEMTQSLYREWFVRFRFPGYEQARFIETEQGRVPEAWEQVPLANAVAYHIGGGWGEEVPTDDSPVRACVIRGTDIPEANRMQLDSIPIRYHKPSNFDSRKLQAEDIVFEVSGGGKDTNVGRSLRITEKLLRLLGGEVICASFCKLIRANKSVIQPELLFWYLVECYSNGVVEQYQVQSTGIKNFKFTVFLDKEKLFLPPPVIRHGFCEHIKSLMSQAVLLGIQNRNLRRTRDLLLPKLISGELDVEHLDIDTGDPEAATAATSLTESS